ncbi:hypothetical protein LTR10_006162 [Elasticomyces elasticus]|nr:hypothetical protein LTR10_006162 [Elasticomyces elasticus]KAK4966788.1 hypothetical protein LTR42_011099 [Elasticomyces elasticus]
MESITVHYRRGQDWSYHQKKFSRWREPGLLRAAKWVLQEAKLVYFRSTRIAISLRGEDVGEVCAWLRAITEGDGNKSLRHVDFHLIAATLDHIHSWLPLAQLFRDYVTCGKVEVHSRIHGSRTFWCVPNGVSRQVSCALEDVMRMGLKARERGWSDEYLKMVYEEWAVAQIPTAKRRRHHYGELQNWRDSLMEGVGPVQRKLAGQLQHESLKEQTSDRSYRFEGKVEHSGQLRMNLRSRKAGEYRSHREGHNTFE